MPRHPVIPVTCLLALGTLCTTGCDQSWGPSETAAITLSVERGTSGGPARMSDWPRWRGPHVDGISQETGWTADWRDGMPKMVWSKNVGIGFSSMAVSNGLLYTMGHRIADDINADKGAAGAGDREGAESRGPETEEARRGTDIVVCLDAATGSVQWDHKYPCLLVDRLHEGGPAATPTVAGDHVYTLSKEGHLFCLDAVGGSIHWQRFLPEDLGVEMPEWGFSSSPLVEDGLVVVDGGRVAAYHAASGELAWTTPEYPAGYGSAVPFWAAEEDGSQQRLLAVLNNHCLLVVRLADGATVARRKWKTSYQTTSTTPIVVDDTIFVSTGYRRGCLLTRLCGKKLEDVYENRDMCNQMNTCVLWDGHLFGFDGNSNLSRVVALTCMDYATGEVKWQQRGLGCGSLMIAGGRLVCLSDDGKLIIVNPSPHAYMELARAQILEGRCWTVPVLSGGNIFARNAVGDLVCVDVGP